MFKSLHFKISTVFYFMPTVCLITANYPKSKAQSHFMPVSKALTRAAIPNSESPGNTAIFTIKIESFLDTDGPNSKPPLISVKPSAAALLVNVI